MLLFALFPAAAIATAQTSLPTPQTHYQILGVEHSADLEAIKKAYRATALKSHPDRFPADKYSPEERQEASLRFEEANEAFSVLSDPEKRRLYDQTLYSQGWSERKTAEGWDMGRHSQKCTVACTLAELGGWKHVPLHAALVVGDMPMNFASRAFRSLIAASRLSLFYGVPNRIYLPPGSVHGDTLKLSLPSGGYLYVYLREMRDGRFERQDNKVHTSIWLSSWHNLRKAPIRLRAPCGSRILLSPRGKTVKHGDICTAPGYGMPIGPNTKTRGDLVVRLKMRSFHTSLLHAILQLGSISTGLAIATNPPVFNDILRVSFTILTPIVWRGLRFTFLILNELTMLT